MGDALGGPGPFGGFGRLQRAARVVARAPLPGRGARRPEPRALGRDARGDALPRARALRGVPAVRQARAPARARVEVVHARSGVRGARVHPERPLPRRALRARALRSPVDPHVPSLRRVVARRAPDAAVAVREVRGRWAYSDARDHSRPELRLARRRRKRASMRAAARSMSSCSQTTTTRHPAARRTRMVCRSRRWFAVSFALHHSAFAFGHDR